MALTPQEQIKVDSGLCKIRYCRKSHLKKQVFCSKHKHERFKEVNPIAYHYNFTKSNAKRRKRPFTLTMEYFKQWCIDNNYIELKGRYKDSMTIDCDKEELGYADGNIQIMSNSSNLKKRWVKWRQQQDIEVPDDYVPPPPEPEQHQKQEIEEELPF